MKRISIFLLLIFFITGCFGDMEPETHAPELAPLASTSPAPESPPAMDAPTLDKFALWTDADAQAAWIEMWRSTAERYRNNPVVIGYDLMCASNAVDIIDEWDLDAFYAT